MQLLGNPIKRQPLNRAPAILGSSVGSTVALVRSFFFGNARASDKSKVSLAYAYNFDRDRFRVLLGAFIGSTNFWFHGKNRVDTIMLEWDKF